MEYVLPGEIVEGAHCDVSARKVDWKGLKKDPITEKLMTLYELDRNASVEVTKEMDFVIEKERQKRVDLKVHGVLGDKLRADKIQLYVNTIRNNVRFQVDEGVTGTHGSHLANISERTIGKIKYALATHGNLLKAIESSKFKEISKL